MKTLKKDIRSGIVIGTAFLATIFTGSIIYAAIGSVWTNPNTLEVGSGSGLTATAWNQLLANFNDLNTRVTALNTTVSGLSAVPTGTVIAFNGTSCPSGWTEAAGVSVPAGVGGNTALNLRGEFIRGWDNGRGIDTGRGFGSFQDQDWKGFYQTNTLQNSTAYVHNDVYMGKSTTAYVGNLFIGYWAAPAAGLGTKWDTSEVRPRNIALLYCVKN